MSLIRCPECGRQGVSDSAEACPSCGYNIRRYVEQRNQQQNEDVEAFLEREKEEQECKRRMAKTRERIAREKRLEEYEEERKKIYTDRLTIPDEPKFSNASPVTLTIGIICFVYGLLVAGSEVYMALGPGNYDSNPDDTLTIWIKIIAAFLFGVICILAVRARYWALVSYRDLALKDFEQYKDKVYELHQEKVKERMSREHSYLIGRCRYCGSLNVVLLPKIDRINGEYYECLDCGKRSSSLEM